MAHAGEVPTEIQCEACGRTREPVTTAPAPAETITHCEWCGAEYPVPGSTGEGGASSPGEREPQAG